MNPPHPRLCLRQKRQYAPCGAACGRRAQENAQKAPDTQCPALETNLWFACPAVAISRSSAPPGLPGGIPDFIRLGRNESPNPGFCLPAKRIPRHAARPARGGRGERAGMEAPDTRVRRSKTLWFTCPAAGDLFGEVPPHPASRAGSPDFSFDCEMNPPHQGFASGKAACTRHAARPRRRRLQENAQAWSAGHLQCPALEDNLWFTCPAA